MTIYKRAEDIMLRKTFENEIQQVKDDVLLLGSMVEQAILSSVDALKKRDIKAAHEILNADALINKKRFEIENKLMILIATQQPMAHDLRLLASCMEIISELERMGDYAKGIANINIRMGDAPLLKPLIDVPRMAQIGVDMLHQALTAFVNEDIETAKSIPVKDDEVDALYNQVYRELMTFVIQDPKTIERANLTGCCGWRTTSNAWQTASQISASGRSLSPLGKCKRSNPPMMSSGINNSHNR
jgi:phosphate transport system protein